MDLKKAQKDLQWEADEGLKGAETTFEIQKLRFSNKAQQSNL